MLCCIFNYAPHYRLTIYQKLTKEFNAHFYFGDRLRNDSIKKMDFTKLEGFQKELKVIFFSFPIGWEWEFGMIGLALDRRYDKYLITPNFMSLNQWLFLVICRILKKKVYSWEHGIRTNNIKAIILRIDKLFHRLLSGAFIYGNKSRDDLIKAGYDERKLQTIYNSLDYDFSKEYRLHLADEPIYSQYFQNEDPVLLFIGRLTEVKKIGILIEAHSFLIKNGIETNIVLIGDGELFLKLHKRVQDNGLIDRYWFRGELYDEIEIARMLYNATICISPGNVGLTAIHAFSYGLPVITNDNFHEQGPEHEVIIEDKNGLFFKDGDAKSLAEKVEYWLKNHSDRHEVRSQCYKLIDTTFNPNNQIKIFRQVFGNK